MKIAKLVLRRVVQMFISVLATTKLMERLCGDLPDLNYIACTVMFSMSVYTILLSYEAPTKIRPIGNYFKDENRQH
jgi:hypothetical protein